MLSKANISCVPINKALHFESEANDEKSAKQKWKKNIDTAISTLEQKMKEILKVLKTD
jgi:hypothetical protein